MSILVKNMAINLTISQKGLLLISVPLLCELVFVFVLFFLQQEAEAAAARELHSKAIVLSVIAVIKSAHDCHFSLYSMRRSGAGADAFDRATADIQKQMQTLRSLIADDTVQTANYERFDKALRKSLNLMTKAREPIHGGDLYRSPINSLLLLERFRPLVYALKERASVIYDCENDKSKLFPEETIKYRNLAKSCLFGGIILNIIITVSLAMYFSRDIISRLSALMGNTELVLSGKPLPAVVKGTDEITQLDVVFHQMAEALAAAAKQKQEFANMVSHDLRTPLMSMSAFLDMLLHGGFGPVSERIKKSAKAQASAVKQVVKLVDELLDIEKMEAGKMVLHLTKASLAEIIESAHSVIADLAERRGITILVECDSGTEVNADEDRLVQVLVNLLSNAIKASEAGKTITVHCMELEHFAEVRVIDEGKGIPKEFRDTIFDRFTQVSGTDGRRLGGTGLGLSICKSIVECHEGHIGLDSSSNGTTFWFRIPRVMRENLPDKLQREP